MDWALAFKALNPPINFNSLFQIVSGREIGEARQAICEFAIEKGVKYIFFIGDDVVIPAHALRNLIYRMEQNEEIGVVGGVYCAKATPAFPLVFRGNGKGSYWDWKIGEFFECTGLGMDCTLIRTEALLGMEKPWFKTVDGDHFLDGKNEAESWTEDLYFCRRILEDTKYRIYCDGGVICDHIDIYGGKKYSLPPGSLPMRQKQVLKDKKALVIGTPLELADESFDITTFGYEGANYRGSLDQLPFEHSQYDFVVYAGADNRLPKYIAELLRVMKSGAKLALLPGDFIDSHQLINFLESFIGKECTRDGTYIQIIK